MLDSEMSRTIIGAVVGFILETIPKLLRRLSSQSTEKTDDHSIQINAGHNIQNGSNSNSPSFKNIKTVDRRKTVIKPRSVVLVVLLFSVIGAAVFWFTGSGGIPNGTYKPIGVDSAMVYDIKIDNHVFTMKTALGISLPTFYSYRNGEFKILAGGILGIGINYTYDEQTGHIVQEIGYADAKIEWARE
ncbi:MAG: hypothetical protein LBJ11_05295 [Oscillospiraceae bacterium]|nr:hypothetical protein [Oscillospiraceae bacterium]